MKIFRTTLLLAVVLASCNSETQSVEDNPKEQETVVVDTTPKVTGIGGVFFLSKNPREIREWYGKNLGMAIDVFDEYGRGNYQVNIVAAV